MVTLKRPAWARYSLMFLSMGIACSSEGDWAELCFSALHTGTVMTVRGTTRDARYHLLFFILELLFFGVDIQTGFPGGHRHESQQRGLGIISRLFARNA